MFSKLFAISALAILAAATPTPNDAPPSGSPQNCNTGSVQCCQQTMSSNSTAIAPILGLLGVIIQDVTALVGLGCSPIDVVGVGSGNAW